MTIITPIRRRRFLRAALVPALASLSLPGLARAQAPLRVTDLLGRTVTLPRPARRIVLGQARHVLALGLLHPDPVSLVVGWGGDLRSMNPPDYAAVRARFPAADAVPLVGRNTVDSLSLEAILAARPDVVILSRGGGGGDSSNLAARLNGYGVPTVVVDFFVDPLRDTLPSIAALGALIGREDRARDFAAFYEARLGGVSSRLAGIAARPSVFVHAHAGGVPCCASPGRGVFDSLVRLAGGTNIGAELMTGVIGQISLEQVLARDPDLYVATAGPYGARGGIPLGQGVPEARAREELRAVLERERLTSLRAVAAGRAHAIWHGFNDTPAHLLAVEALARWIHPERCGDLDPAATLEELNARFLAIPMAGAHWADLGRPG